MLVTKKRITSSEHYDLETKRAAILQKFRLWRDFAF